MYRAGARACARACARAHNGANFSDVFKSGSISARCIKISHRPSACLFTAPACTDTFAFANPARADIVCILQRSRARERAISRSSAERTRNMTSGHSPRLSLKAKRRSTIQPERGCSDFYPYRRIDSGPIKLSAASASVEPTAQRRIGFVASAGTMILGKVIRAGSLRYYPADLFY